MNIQTRGRPRHVARVVRRPRLAPQQEILTRHIRPISVYDKLPLELRPFRWAKPAPNDEGVVPAPWRVASGSALQELARRGFGDPDLYVLGGDQIDGHLVLDVGHATAGKRKAELLGAVAQAFRNEGFRVEFSKGDNWVHLIDDLPRDVLKRASKPSVRW